MSINANGVHLDRPQKKRRFIILGAIVGLEAVFSFLLYFSLAARIFAPNPAESASGIPPLLSYQGRLTDSSGNLLGGTGTPYCFRYSIYDSPTTGSKLWPSGTPTNSTTTVRDGIFNDQIGRMDTLTYDFFSTSTVYLNVDVNTTTSTCGGSWESLLPRQQITASGFSLSAQSVYGSALRTTTSTKVQVGTGGGVPSGQTLLSLDQRNTADTIGGSCTDNGSLWYNSADTKALVCENSVIRQISNPTSTIAGITTNTATAINAGTVVFSNGNGVTFGLNGSTITASVAAAGGGASASYFEPYPAISSRAMGQGTYYMQRVYVPFTMEANIAGMGLHISNSASAGGTISQHFGIYTRNASTWSLASGSSGSWAYNSTLAASSYTRISGTRMRTFNIGSWNLTPGDYMVGMGWSVATALTSGSYTYILNRSAASLVGSMFGAGNDTAPSRHGVYSAATNANPTSIAITQINQTGSAAGAQPYFILADSL